MFTKKQKAPELRGITHWFNSMPLSIEKLSRAGKVVLLDFWTYSCINCIRTLPVLKEWHEKYSSQGLVIIGVEAPEFDFERDPANVRQAIVRFDIPYPVALDANMETWSAYENRYWPHHYLIDREGNIRHDHIGEGDYQKTEEWIQKLLAEANPRKELIPLPMTGKTPGVDFSQVETPEIYCGWKRLSNFASAREVHRDENWEYRVPAKLPPSTFALEGVWRIEPERVVLAGERGTIAVRYVANKANIVLEAPMAMYADVYVDGKPLTEKNKGADVEIRGDRSVARIAEARLYNFIAMGDEYGDHTLEVSLPSTGVRAYAFTFG
ncbi:MAG: thioredoxin family protein [Patescibacteria group bacterium]